MAEAAGGMAETAGCMAETAGGMAETAGGMAETAADEGDVDDARRRYPAHWEADAVLADGAPVQLRPVRATDAAGIAEFRARLSASDETRLPVRWAEQTPEVLADRLTATDHDTRLAVAAVLRGRVVGVAEYERLPASDDALVALVVEATHRGRGLGPLLLEHLIGAARERAVRHLVADLLDGDVQALRVFRAAGFVGTDRQDFDGRRGDKSRHGDKGGGGGRSLHVLLPTAQSPRIRRISWALEQQAEASGVARLLTPRTVAVVGASREPGTVGHEVFRRLLSSDFRGPAYPVNPATRQVASVYAYPDVRDIPDSVDLAVIAVPAPAVADAVRACAEKDVRSLVVVSAGFAEAGPAGQARLAEVTRLARESGMRLIGPNAMGVINTDPEVRLHATFAAGEPLPGRVGAFTQSGALAGTFLTEASRRAIGLSTFVSTGDRSDVSANDLLQYWQSDDRTDVIMLHLQGFGNPRKFARIARRTGRRKPVIALKSGRIAADPALDALFSSAGVVRVDTLGQLFDAAALLAFQPLPAGRRVGIVGTSSALAALATDACRTVGLRVPPFSTTAAATLTRELGYASPVNPVDLGAMATPERFEAALRAVAESGDVDAVLALVTPHPAVPELARAVRDLAARGSIPVVASYLGHDGVPPALAVLDETGTPGPGSVPSYASPESAALALARAADHAAWRGRDQGTVPDLDRIDLDRVRRAVDHGAMDGSWLPQELVVEILAGIGLTVWPSRRVSTPAEALAAAEQAGWPVALKIADERFRGRLDVGAVRLGVEGPAALADAWRTVRDAVGPGEMLVQPMAPAGVSTVVRMTQDPAIGPLLSLRLGGVVADLLVDPLARTLPLTDRDAADLVREIRGNVLLVGGSGAPATDTAALEDVLHRLARLAEEVPAVAEVLLDPVLVGRPGVVLLHAGVRLLPPETDPESLPRRMTGTGVDYFV